MTSYTTATPTGPVFSFRVLLAAMTACAAVTVQAAVPWHPDLAQAKAASLISHRPVLIVFTAKWSDASIALDEKTLANPEAMALVTACFEPVKVDVDADPETTRRMGVSYLPTACVVDLDDRVLATFDCPDNPASFIAAAGRAAQDAAAAKGATPASPAPAASQTRSQSDFAAATVAAPPSPAPVAVSDAVAAEPRLSPTPPPAWPAEVATTPTTTSAFSTSATAPARPSLEPAPATTAPAAPSVASWLGDRQPALPAPTPAAATPPAPQANAPLPPPLPAQALSQTPTTPVPAPSPPAPAPEEKPKQANAFVAALQKPFALLPKWPGTGKATAAPTAAQPTAPAPAAAATDSYGSMPLGLEGYCPVTLVEKGSWVEGRAHYGARHRGRTYLFAGADEQRAFLADPDRYAPALSGDDPVMAFDAGKSIPGQRRYGVTYQSKVYLFSSPDTRTVFTADPGKYTSRVRLAEAGQTTAGTVQR
jgi:YHS domain-containing protein